MQADPSSQQEMPLSSADDGETVTSLPPVFSSGVIDREQGWGQRRLMAVASTIAPDNHLLLNAEALLDFLTDAFFGAPLVTVDLAFSQAVEATLSHIQSASAESATRPVIGLAAAALEDERLVLAVLPPCRAVLWQDREILVLPKQHQIDADDVADRRMPEIQETTLNAGDRLAFLAAPDTAADTAFKNAEALEQAAGPAGSFLWLEVSEDPAPPPPPPPPQNPDEPLPPVPAEQVVGSAAMTGGTYVKRELISASGGPRLLQRPPGSDALHRYRSTSRSGTPSALRSRLPRGAPPLRAVLLIIAVVAIFAAAAFFAAQRRPERTYQQSATAAQYSEAVAAAIAADDTDLVNALLPGAHTLLDRAGGEGSDSDDAVSLRTQIVAANDYLNVVIRLEDPRKIGVIPEELLEHHLSLVQAAGVLYLLGGDLYVISVPNRQLVALPELIPEQSAGLLINGGGDISTLAVTSAASAYFFGDAVDGSAMVAPDWPATFGRSRTDATVFSNRLYMIDLNSGEIVVIDPESGETTLWIQRDSDILPESPIGMAIDGTIHVLYASGDLYALKEGYVVGKSTLAIQPVLTNPAAITYDGSDGTIYIADAGSPEGRLIAWDSESEETSTFLLGPDEFGRLNSDAHHGFVSMDDLLVSGATGTVTWIANGAIWQADLPAAEPEDNAPGAATPEAQ